MTKSAARKPVRPTFNTGPDYSITMGPEVADLGDLTGFIADAPQREVLTDFFAEQTNGLPATFENVLIATRQQIKTGTFKIVALGKLFLTSHRRIVWSAHEFKTTQDAHRELCQLIAETPALRARLKGGRPEKGFILGNGEEAIELQTGQRLEFRARTITAGRGLAGDDTFLDEAFALKPAHLGSLLPTMAARPWAQVFYGSSAGMADSTVLRRLRDRGRGGGEPRLRYIEFCDYPQGGCKDPACDHELNRPGCAFDDEQRWAKFMPTLGDRVTIEMVRDLRRAMPVEEFGREMMGWWDEPGGAPVIPDAVWAANRRPKWKLLGSRTPALAVDVDPMRTHTSIALAGRTRRRRTLIKIAATGEGTAWAPGKIVRLARKHGISTVHLVAGTYGGAEVFVPALEEAGLETHVINGRELGSGCGAFYDLAIAGDLAHLDQPALNEALASARLKSNGEGAWIWSRRRSSDDITPLMAATAALQGHRAGDEDGELSVYFFDELEDDEEKEPT